MLRILIAISLGLLAAHVSTDCEASGKLSPIHINEADRTRYYTNAISNLFTAEARGKLPMTVSGEQTTPEFYFMEKVKVVFPSYFSVGTEKGVEFEYLKVRASNPATLQQKLTGSDESQVEVQLHGRNLDQDNENAPDYNVAVSVLYAVSDRPTPSSYERAGSGSASETLGSMITDPRTWEQDVVLSVFFPSNNTTIYTYSGNLTDKVGQCKQNVFWIVYEYSESEVRNIHVSQKFFDDFTGLFGADARYRSIRDGGEVCPVTKHSFGQGCLKVFDGDEDDCAEAGSSKSDAEFCAGVQDGNYGDGKDDGTTDDCEKNFNCDQNSGKISCTCWIVAHAGVLAILAYWYHDRALQDRTVIISCKCRLCVLVKPKIRRTNAYRTRG